jgi:hypothetical protein
MMFELQKSNINGVVTGRIQGTDTVEFQYPPLPANEILRCQWTDCRQGAAVNQKEEDESKCREFVDQLNRLAAHERYRYIGHVSELDRKDFPDCLIMDRRTSRELHVECTRFAPEWRTVEKANIQILERRFANDLNDIGYESYDIFLQTRNPSEHPLQKLNRSGVEDLARNVKRFLADQRPQVGEQGVMKFNLDDFPTYVPLTTTFQFLLLTKRENPEAVSRLDDGSSVVQVGVLGYEASEMEQRLDKIITSKLRGPGDTADILLIYSAGPLYLLDAPKTASRLKELAQAHNAQQSFRELWFLAHYWTGDQKLYRVA